MPPDRVFLSIISVASYISTVEAAYMGRLGTVYSCLLYPLSLISVVQLTGPGIPGDGNMRAN